MRETNSGGSGLASRARKSAAGNLAGLGNRLVQLVLPPSCLACNKAVANEGTLCVACWSRLSLIERPYCERLGLPFAYDPGPGALSPEAIAHPPPFDRLRAVSLYDDVARRLVYGLKYNDHLELVRWMAGWMARSGAALVRDADLIVPVPLHRRRLWWRRFNQSAALAVSIGGTGGKGVALTALSRSRATRRQVGLGATERARNVRGAFAVTDAGRDRIAGRRVLVVDDVYTTGATANSVTRSLLRAGAAAVDILVFARVAGPAD